MATGAIRYIGHAHGMMLPHERVTQSQHLTPRISTPVSLEDKGIMKYQCVFVFVEVQFATLIQGNQQTGNTKWSLFSESCKRKAISLQ